MASLRGLSRMAQPQRLVISYVYDLPLFRNQKGPQSMGWMAPVIGRVLGGWQISGNTTFASGNPFTVFLGYDMNGDGIGGDRPFLLDPGILGRSVDNARIDPSTGRQYAQAVLPLSAFSPTAQQAATRSWPWYPGSGMVGSLGRNTFWSHGENNFDFGLSKEVRVFENHRFPVPRGHAQLSIVSSSACRDSSASWTPPSPAISFSRIWGGSPGPATVRGACS
jgi:hypothetical protein